MPFTQSAVEAGDVKTKKKSFNKKWDNCDQIGSSSLYLIFVFRLGFLYFFEDFS